MTELERAVWANAFAAECRWQTGDTRSLKETGRPILEKARKVADRAVQDLRRLKRFAPEAGEVVSD